jgi:integrase
MSSCFNRATNVKIPPTRRRKAVNALLTQAKANGTFHGFRHWHITQMRGADVSDYAQKVQTGHTRGGEHMDYGDLPFSERDAALIRDLPMPKEVDFGPLMRLDFAALRR